MKKKVWSMTFVVTALALILFSLSGVREVAAEGEASLIVGAWKGEMAFQGVKIGMIFKISEKEGKLSATLDVPIQSGKDIPIESVTFENHQLFIKVAVANGVYKGTYSPETKKITGEWEQNGLALALTLEKTAVNDFTLNRPQEPKPPYPYDEEEVKVATKASDVVLAGTLTTPKTGGPFPAVILITGSGPQDRNEELLGHKPFMVLADRLTRNNIAVLRLDDRGVGKSTGDHGAATSRDFAADITAAFDFLLQHQKIDKTRVGLMGHSEGGVIAPMISSERKDVAFIVLLAGTGLRGDKVLLSQSELINTASGMAPEKVKEQAALLKMIITILETQKDPQKAEAEVLALANDNFKAISEEEKKAQGINEQAVAMRVKALCSSWFRFFLFYDPAPALQKTACPVLALIGEKDLQVSCKENLPAIREALKHNRHKTTLAQELPSLNHLFQTCKTGNIGEYSTIEETIAPQALDLITNWILEVVKK